ncbi:hypothetical protein [Dongia sp. agr-C8]
MMKMRVAFAVAGLALGAFLASAVAQAATYDLAADFSSANSLGSPWSITYNGGTTLPTQAAVGSNGNHLEPAIPGAFFGTGTNLNSDNPFAFVAGKDGSQAGLTDGDFLTGDVVIHTPNSGSDLTIAWTAPVAGIIDNLVFDVWYAHSSVTRSNNVEFSLGATVLNWVTSTAQNSNRSGAGGATGGPVSVNAGDLLTLTFAKTAGLPPGSDFGSLTGLNLAFDFTASAVTPIPATLPLFVSALAGLGWFARRRRQQA